MTVNLAIQPKDAVPLSRKAWTAYLRIVLWALFFFGLVAPLIWKYGSPTVTIVVSILAGLMTIYDIFLTLSYHLYYNDSGVWFYAGVFPWSSGVRGVKWRDLDEAVYYPNILSWIGKSYTIHLSHRFTKSSEIILDHMADGNRAAEIINDRHLALLRRSQV